LRHTAKCRLGAQCPVPLCVDLHKHPSHVVFTFEEDGKTITYSIDTESFKNTCFRDHPYAQCREVVEDESELDDVLQSFLKHGCFCAAVRVYTKRIVEASFPPQPLSLEFYATCAVPDISPALITWHQDAEQVLRFYYMAKRVQKWWRSHLQRRGLYRIRACKYYDRGGSIACRQGVFCRFAHGKHDIRHKFVPSLQELQQNISTGSR
jgi:Zinc finger C-x8-C-x5-C-x3-H type (and similar)